MKSIIILGLWLYIGEIACDKLCDSLVTCSACIGHASERCIWCSQPNITSPRCQSEITHLNNKKWCRNENVYNPNMVTRISNATDIPTFDLNPRKDNKNQTNVTKTEAIKLRPGGEFKFQMVYEPAEDFPLDVYYLMDFSKTMNDHIENFQKQAQQVYNDLTKFTNNVRFGVGSFVEKPQFPYVNTKVHKAYTFKNHLSLTNDMKKFQNAIYKHETGSNFDLPEAGLDALMQVMTCHDKLGWRDDARRIIILCTDSTYHSAGDGKMVGAAKPNDMSCHLNKSDMYDHDLIYDYPSISQVAKVTSQGNFLIIFAALNSVRLEYTELASQILASRYAELKSDSNILDIIKTAYLESVRYVIIKHQAPPYVQLTLRPDCTKNDVCELTHKKKITIDASLKVQYCPMEIKDFHHNIEIGVVSGGLSQKLKLTVDMHCKCECEKDIVNSSLCSNSGTFQCGVCECNKNRYGNKCQCDGINVLSELIQCRRDEKEAVVCSGRGVCVCGKCTCNNGYSGDFCEFSDESCQIRNDKLCSGHGVCTLGACECDSNHWVGDDCSCSVHQDNCIAPYSEQICSNHGDCICNECVCRTRADNQAAYTGVFCEDCDDCAEERCKELQNYVYCNYLKNKTVCDQSYQHNQTIYTDVQMMNKSQLNNAKWPTAKWCHIKMDEEKSIVFVHRYDKNDKKFVIAIQNEPEKAAKPDIVVPVCIAIATVILLGLLTLLGWKIITNINDKKEYIKFMEKAKEEGYEVSENPIFQPAAFNFNNPMYVGTKEE